MVPVTAPQQRRVPSIPEEAQVLRLNRDMIVEPVAAVEADTANFCSVKDKPERREWVDEEECRGNVADCCAALLVSPRNEEAALTENDELRGLEGAETAKTFSGLDWDRGDRLGGGLLEGF